MSNYQAEKYWSEVGKRIQERERSNIIAGDDEPYYRYKRREFLKLLREVDFSGKRILEIGCGPGGNLQELLKLNPSKITGADISQQMLDLAKAKLPDSVSLVKTNGTELPFPDSTFDIVFTATVLQHNTDEEMLNSLIKEICRVSSDQVILFERIETTIKGDETNLGRPISYYSKNLSENSFNLTSSKFLKIRASYYVCGAIRKYLNSRNRAEGEALNSFSIFLQKLTLSITRLLDYLITTKKDLGRLIFVKSNVKLP